MRHPRRIEKLENFQITGVIAASARSIPLRICNQIPQSYSGIGSSIHGSMTSWLRSKLADAATDSATRGRVLGGRNQLRNFNNFALVAAVGAA